MQEKTIILLGDIHGEFGTLMYNIKIKKLSNCIIIQVGDFGVGFEHYTNQMIILEKLNDFLIEKDIILYAIRGNHDDPEYFNGSLNPKHLSNVKLLPDYTVLNLEGNNILFVGGAISIDRCRRRMEMQIDASYGGSRKSWWENERFILDEEKLKQIKGVDIVVTHDCPTYCWPTNENGVGKFVDGFLENDPDLLNDLVEERKNITKMAKLLKENGNWVKYWYYGHYHRNEISLNSNTTYVLLNINELRLIDTQGYS